MKKNFLLHFLLLVLVVIGVGSCCKDKNPNVPGCQKEKPLPDEHHEYWLGEAKDYMYFKHGTWWVYKNMQNGKTDSVYVTLSKLDTTTIRGTETYSSHRIYTSETCRIVTKSQRYNEFYDWHRNSPNPDATNVSSGGTVWQRSKSPGGSWEVGFHTPFTLGLRTDAILLNKDTSLNLSGKIYSNVKIFRIKRDDTYPHLLDEIGSNGNFHMHIYYAPGYGIIKYEEPLESKSIELIRSNIIQ